MMSNSDISGCLLRIRLGSLIVMMLIFIQNIVLANDLPTSQPLFDSSAVLHLHVQLPFKQLARDRTGKPEYLPGEITYVDAKGATVKVDIDLRTRGKMRRKAQTCAFPPLKIRVRDAPASSVFKNQKTLKLVTHCQNKNINDQYVLKEYLAYQIYNIFTDYSIRARLVRVSYTEAGELVAHRYAIILEHWKMVAARMGAGEMEILGGLSIEQLDDFTTSLMSLFQYMIGNDDWSALKPAADDECCHNVRPVSGHDNKVVPLPYDFDYSGLVDTTYAVSKSGNRNVRKRRYAGYCGTQAGLQAAANHMRSSRDEVYVAVDQVAALSPRESKRTRRYLNRFYEVLDDPGKFEKRILKRCRED